MRRRQLPKTYVSPVLKEFKLVKIKHDENPPKYLIRSNEMLRAKQERDLPVTAYRFVYFALGHLRLHKLSEKASLEFPFSYLSKHVPNRNNGTEDLKERLDELTSVISSYGLSIFDEKANVYKNHVIFPDFKADLNTDIVSLSVNPNFMKHLIHFDKEFTLIDYKYIKCLNTTPQIKMYELIKSYDPKKMPVFKISLQNLYRHTQQPKKIQYSDFKRKFLEPCQNKFLKETDRTFEVESEIKQGRAVESLIIRTIDANAQLRKFNSSENVIRQHPIQEQHLLREMFDDIERWSIRTSPYQLYQMNRKLLKKGVDHVDERCNGKTKTKTFLNSL